MVAAENDALPKGKVGGIGDVIRDIPKYLVQQQQSVSVITPSYGYQATFDYAEHLYHFKVAFAGKLESIDLYQLHLDDGSGVTQYVLENELFANAGVGNIYCDDGAKRPFASDASKFALFSTAICELLISQWRDQFDIIHLHDWHTAFIAIHRALNPKYQALQTTRCVYTIHNLALQGTRPFKDDSSAFQTWFPELAVDYSQIADPNYGNCVNPARAGINLSDAVHVVSPTYATEVIKPSDAAVGFIGGEGLELDLQNAQHEQRLFGILNGCQYDIDLPTKVAQPEFLADIQKVLLIWMSKNAQVKSTHFIAYQRINTWLKTASNGPLLTSVGRLTTQKVALLVLERNHSLVLEQVLASIENHQGRLLILGSGDPQLEQAMTLLMAKHENFIFLNGYDDLLSQQVYQQGDLFLMPSSFEPCGISQMLAMRAGQPCLVHEIGGLKDTVEHLKSGFCFSGSNINEQLSSLSIELNNALTLFNQDKTQWDKIASQAKKQRFTWPNAIKDYLKFLY